MFESLIGINFWTALFILGNTLLLLYVATKFLFVPVKNMIDSRQKEIDDMYAEAGSAKEQAQAIQEEYQQKLATAQQTSERIVKEAVDRGRSREEEIIRKANEEAAAIMDKASADIEMEKKKAINDAKDDIAGLSMAIASKVVARELNADDQKDLIARFNAELGETV